MRGLWSKLQKESATTVLNLARGRNVLPFDVQAGCIVPSLCANFHG